METTQFMQTLDRIEVNGAVVFLEDLGPSEGRVTINGWLDKNYSHHWGAMSGKIREFLCHIDKNYFATKLIGSRSHHVMDVKATFKELRRTIRVELDLPWYKHREFQKEMRIILKDFQDQCEDREDDRAFLDLFRSSFLDRLPLYLVQDLKERSSIESGLQGLTPWEFIQQKPSEEYIWLLCFHDKLKRALKTKQQ